jgi:hypothetical protein
MSDQNYLDGLVFDDTLVVKPTESEKTEKNESSGLTTQQLVAPSGQDDEPAPVQQTGEVVLPEDLEPAPAQQGGGAGEQDQQWFELDDDELPQERLVDKLSQPGVLVIAGGLMLSAVIIGPALCGSSRQPAQVATEAKGRHPSFDAPEVPDEVPGREQIQRELDKASRQVGRRQQVAASKPNPSEVVGVPAKAKPAPASNAQLADQTQPKPIPPTRSHRRRPSRRARSKAVAAQRVEVAQQTQEQFVYRSSYYKPAKVQVVGESKTAVDAGLDPGTIIRAKLRVGISTDYPQAVVLATVTQQVVVDKQVIIPVGSTLQGRLRGAGQKLYLDFSSASLQGGKKIALVGYAVSGDLPGLPAKVVRKTNATDGEQRTSSALARGAMATAGGVVGRLAGTTVGHELARNVAQEGMHEVRQGYSGAGAGLSSVTLEIPAGTEFELLITG